MRASYLLVILAAAFSFAAMARSPFNHPDEFNYIAGARTMIETGDYVTPRYNFAPRVVKPVLFYWLVAGSFKIFGTGIYIARLCSAASAVAGVVLVGLTARHLLGRRCAFMAMLIAASQLTVVQFSRFAITDTTLWAFCSLAQYAFFRMQFPDADDANAAPMEPKNSWRLAMLFSAGTALALLTKGPIALLWCGLPVTWLLIRRDWTGLRRLHLLAGIGLMLVIVAPWASLFVYRNHALLHAMLWNPSSPESYAQFSSPVAGPREFFAIVPLVFMSILLWIPAIIASMLTGRRDSSAGEGLLVFWLIAIIVLLGLAHRKDFRYVLPLAMPVTLLLAPPMYRLFNDRAHCAKAALLAIFFAMLSLMLGAAVAAVISHTPTLPAGQLWPLVGTTVGAAVLLAYAAARPALHRTLPAILIAMLFVLIGIVDWQTAALTKPRPETLAPVVEGALKPGEALLCYQMPARELIYLSRRPQIEVKSIDRFTSALDDAPAVLVRENDWLAVPATARGQFQLAGECVAQRQRFVCSLNLADNRERVLLLLRKR